MNNYLKSNIDLLSNTFDFRETMLLPDKRKTKWLPVLACDSTGYFIGVLENGYWAAESKEGLYCLDRPQRYMYVMSLLEQPIRSVQKKLSEFFNVIDTEVNINDLFPFVSIVKAGMEQGSEYWANLAFEWYKEFSSNKKRQLLESISIIVEAKWASQGQRQMAKKELGRLTKKFGET